MTTEKICFRYDGSDEAKKCIEWINEKFHKGLLRQYEGMIDKIYDNQGCNWKASEPKPPIRLVPPAEFLRIVKGKSDKPHWIIGGKCTIPYGVNGAREVATIVAFHAEWAWVLVGIRQYFSIPVYQLRPARKSLREEINKIVEDWLLSKNQYDLADRIIELVKERKGEL